jgi:predicted MFS family arabinose efflux permease
LAGVLIASSGAALAFWVNAATFLIANGFIARIKGEVPRTRLDGQVAPGWFDDLKTGLQYALKNKALRVVLITTFVSSIARATLMTVEVVYITDTLNGGDKGYALMLSVAGIGALIGSINVARLSRRFSLPSLYVSTVLMTGLMFFPYANIPVLWFVIIVAGLHTVPWVVSWILLDTMLQQWVVDEMRGRVFSLIETERNAGQVLVAAIFAPFIDLWGPVAILNISGVMYTIAGVYVILQLGVLRLAGDSILSGPTLSEATLPETTLSKAT